MQGLTKAFLPPSEFETLLDDQGTHFTSQNTQLDKTLDKTFVSYEKASGSRPHRAS